jgi:hypothetical protein
MSHSPTFCTVVVNRIARPTVQGCITLFLHLIGSWYMFEYVVLYCLKRSLCFKKIVCIVQYSLLSAFFFDKTAPEVWTKCCLL